MTSPKAQRPVIALIAAVKFVYILDFMMLMPLGPDLVKALGFDAGQLGWLSAAYTLASMLAGLSCVRWLDRFDRKPAFLACFGLLIVFTALTPLASNLYELLLIRALTGFAGAPAVALGMAIVIDSTSPQQRGAAIGKVMIGFSLAAVAGIPLALELARLQDWRAPFVLVATLGAGVWFAAASLLPNLHVHQRAGTDDISPWSLLSQPAVRKACIIQACNQFAAFLVVPHFSAFFLLNLGFPREWLGSLYLAGGIAALMTMQLLGRLADARGPATAVAIASLLTLIGLLPFLGLEAWPLVIPFVLFMAGNAGRNVSIAALTSQVPVPAERAGYMALEGMVQDIAITVAALLACTILVTRQDGSLEYADLLGALAAMLVTFTFAAVWRWQPELQRGN